MVKSKKFSLSIMLCAIMALCLSVGVFGLTQKPEVAYADSVLPEGNKVKNQHLKSQHFQVLFYL